MMRENFSRFAEWIIIDFPDVEGNFLRFLGISWEYFWEYFGKNLLLAKEGSVVGGVGVGISGSEKGSVSQKGSRVNQWSAMGINRGMSGNQWRVSNWSGKKWRCPGWSSIVNMSSQWGWNLTSCSIVIVSNDVVGTAEGGSGCGGKEGEECNDLKYQIN